MIGCLHVTTPGSDGGQVPEDLSSKKKPMCCLVYGFLEFWRLLFTKVRSGKSLQNNTGSVHHRLYWTLSSIDLFSTSSSCPPYEFTPPSRVIITTWLKPDYCESVTTELLALSSKQLILVFSFLKILTRNLVLSQLSSEYWNLRKRSINNQGLYTGSK